MTFDAAIQTTYGEAFADLRDKVSGMANWAIWEDNTGGAPSVYNDYFVLETPTGEHIRVNVNSWCYPEYGVSWDTANNNWADRYAVPNNRIAPVDGSNPPNETDAVKYWLEYVDNTGFAIYMTREVGDSNDYEMAFGFAKLTKLWNYDAATAREGDYVYFGHGEASKYGDKKTRFNATAERGRSGDTFDARGLVNPDGNFANYPAHETNVIASKRYQNSNNRDAVIGTHTLWMREDSGDATAHQDTITDGAGDEYMVLKEYGLQPIALRMD